MTMDATYPVLLLCLPTHLHAYFTDSVKSIVFLQHLE